MGQIKILHQLIYKSIRNIAKNTYFQCNNLRKYGDNVDLSETDNCSDELYTED